MRNKILVVLIIFSCKSPEKKIPLEKDLHPSNSKSRAPLILEEPSEDSLFYYTKKQIEFGLRVPGTQAHKKCAQWIANTLSNYNFDTIIQRHTTKTFNNYVIPIYNIIGVKKGTSKDGILIGAHWDSREPSLLEKNLNNKFEGAIDGASGVATLLEIARIISKVNLNLSIVIVFFDGEDWGPSSQLLIRSEREKSFWCLGSQIFCNNFPIREINIRYGILVDMPGAPNPSFPMEETSIKYAENTTKSLWELASKSGLAPPFIQKQIPSIIDDHLFLNTLCHIPTTLIINYDIENNTFGFFHHNHEDNIKNLSTKGMKAVAKTILLKIQEDNKKANL